MWSTDSIWFEISILNIFFAFGNLFFAHFEHHTSLLRKLFKYILFNLIVIFLSMYLGREWSLGFLGIMALSVLIIHTIILPKNGINGWTAEPKELYYKYRGWEDKL
jgi:hypothetical protein